MARFNISFDEIEDYLTDEEFNIACNGLFETNNEFAEWLVNDSGLYEEKDKLEFGKTALKKYNKEQYGITFCIDVDNKELARSVFA